MRICIVLYDPQESGGLEEYATTLAIGLHERGHQVSVLSTTWVPADNQYLRRLRDNKVTVAQLPRWLSRPASHWPTKQKILDVALWLTTPLAYLLATWLFLGRKTSWKQALTSARGWLHGQLLGRLIGPDRRKPLGYLLLNWWRFRWRPELLHIQGYTNATLFLIDWASAHNVPVVYEEHQTPDVQFDWWQGFEESINKATTVVAVSDTSAEALRAVCGVTRPIVVRSPLLPDPIVSGWSKNGGSRSSNEPLHVTTVARLDVAKGLTYLLETIVRVRKLYPNTCFEVYGDGDLRQELLTYADELGLDGDDIFVGAFTDRDELSRIMAGTDIFVMSSILEGQPLALVEAMAYGCPIVTTSVGGVPELIKDGFNGLLCTPRDPDCLADKICTLVENPALRATLGRAARESYKQGPYQPEALSEHFTSIYQQAVKGGDYMYTPSSLFDA